MATILTILADLSTYIIPLLKIKLPSVQISTTEVQNIQSALAATLNVNGSNTTLSTKLQQLVAEQNTFVQGVITTIVNEFSTILASGQLGLTDIPSLLETIYKIYTQVEGMKLTDGTVTYTSSDITDLVNFLICFVLSHVLPLATYTEVQAILEPCVGLIKLVMSSKTISVDVGKVETNVVAGGKAVENKFISLFACCSKKKSSTVTTNAPTQLKYKKK